MTRAVLLLALLSACGGGECEWREVACPPTDPLHANFATCYVCGGADPERVTAIPVDCAANPEACR